MANQEFIDEVLKAHNAYRDRHQVPPLAHNQDLTKQAQKWAEQLAESNMFVHSQSTFHGMPVGENIAMKSSSKEEDYNGQEVTDQWYNEVQMYRFSGGRRHSGLFMCGHFTQLIWKNSKELGVGKAQSKDGKLIVVVMYCPAGNVSGDYDSNVMPTMLGSTTSLRSVSRHSGMKMESVEELTGRKSAEILNNSNNNACMKSTSLKNASCFKPPAINICTGGGLNYNNDESLEDMSKNASKHKFKTPFVESLLKAHNHARAKHDVPELMHNDDLARYAQEWAEVVVHLDAIKHSPCTVDGMRVGENIACKFDMGGFMDYSGKEVVDQWYNEINNYDFETHKGTDCGNFTQLVWKSSRHIGVGKAKNREGKVVVVVCYRPPGNVVGLYEENVLPPIPEEPEEGLKAVLSGSKTALSGCIDKLSTISLGRLIPGKK